MTTETVQINSLAYDTYASVEQGDEYLAANFLATAWFDLTEDQKAQLLVTATRLFNRQCWLGEKTEADQPLQWPRTNTGIEGVVDNEVPTNIINGSIEMAFAILDGNEAINNSQPGAQKLRSIGAGSVNLSWFRGAEGVRARFDRFPLPVQELIGRYLCSSMRITPLTITGTSGGFSVTDDDLGYNEGI
jgi:DnaT-like ssDNA binding protein